MNYLNPRVRSTIEDLDKLHIFERRQSSVPWRISTPPRWMTSLVPPREVLTDALRQVMNHAAQGLLRVDSERVALRDIEGAWERDVHGRRLVVIP
jgi:hypothetical protein